MNSNIKKLDHIPDPFVKVGWIRITRQYVGKSMFSYWMYCMCTLYTVYCIVQYITVQQVS